MKQFKNNIAVDFGSKAIKIIKEGKLIKQISPEIEIDGILYDNLILNGKIANLNGLEVLLRKEIRKLLKPILGFIAPKFSALVVVPSDLNEITLRAYRDIMEFQGANCLMIANCFIAASGLDLTLKDTCSMIVDSGAGKTSITTLKNNNIKENAILDVAGIDLDKAMITYLSSTYNLKITLSEAEKLRINYVDLREISTINNKIKITGKDKQTKDIKEINIDIQELINSILPNIDFIIYRIQRQLDSLDFDDVELVKSEGVHLVGGLFRMKGLIDYIRKKVKISEQSYNIEVDYMKVGLEKVQLNPYVWVDKIMM